MNESSVKILRTVSSAAVLIACACAPGISGSASDIARLEYERAAKPNSEQTLRSLGIAYFKANRLTDARTALQRAASMAPSDGPAALYLGLTAEAQNDLPAARAAYDAYLKVGKTRSVRNQIAERITLVARKEHDAAAKQAIAQERQLSSVPGSPRTVAVMPFAFTGSDTSLRPLERGFAELVATDLSRSSQLTVVERDRLQALLAEMRLQQSGVAEGTGVRAGKILQAGRLVGGNISQLGTDLRASAFVTDVQSAQSLGAGASGQQPIDQVFTLEKNVVLRLFADMNVTLTTAERNAIEERPTRSLAAFLAYSRGLEASDRGRFDEAARYFDNAVRLDPGFAAARQHGQEMRGIAAGALVTVGTIESGLRGTVEGQAITGSASGATAIGTTALITAEGLNPSVVGAAASGGGGAAAQPTKDPASGTGGDNVTATATKVTLVIHQPKP